MRKRIVDEILETIQIYARNQMFTAVLDSAGQSLNGVQNVLFTESRADITSDIVGVLNKGQVNTSKDVATPGKSPRRASRRKPRPRRRNPRRASRRKPRTRPRSLRAERRRKTKAKK